MEITDKITGEPVESNFELVENPQKTIQDELAAVEKQFEKFRENTERQIESVRNQGYRQGIHDRKREPGVLAICLCILFFFCLPWYMTKVFCQILEKRTDALLENILAMKDCAGSAPLFDNSLG